MTGDYRLSHGSPCIDAGDNSAVPADILEDIEGDPRILDGDIDGTATVDMGADEVTPLAPAGLPFLEDFESSRLEWCWSTNLTGTGRMNITTANGPASGTSHLTMDSYSRTKSLNQLVLHIDLAGKSNIMITFWHKEFNDRDNRMSPSFIGSENSDGVAVSNDGITWYRAKGLTTTDGISKDWQCFEVDLDATIALAGISYTDGFQIKFQQYDNNAIPKRGFAFDDIEVYEYMPPAPAAFPFFEDFESAGLADYWSTRCTDKGRIAVTKKNRGAVSGNYLLTMHRAERNADALNQLVLSIDLLGQSNVTLSFWHKEFKHEEDHVMPDTFSGAHFSDGVAISDDGINWYKVQGLTSADGITTGWQFFQVDLDTAIANAGITYNDAFQIKFQQCADARKPKDGFAFDDIEVN